MSKELGITPRAENYSEWCNELVKKADLAENSVVRGCMVIKPHGYAIWELMQGALDRARGETAALRSLANAARMMDENPNLLQLRWIHAVGDSKGATIVLSPSGMRPEFLQPIE